MSHVTRTLSRGGLLVLLAAVVSCVIAVPMAERRPLLLRALDRLYAAKEARPG